MTLGRQKLQQYFKDRPKLRQEQFAMVIEYSASYLSQVLSGERSPPGGRFAAKVHTITGIDSIDWYQEAEDE
ncbi:MAG: hypothetical protein V3V81_07585 [Candidatus Bathyarchaeia archaeon]